MSGEEEEVGWRTRVGADAKESGEVLRGFSRPIGGSRSLLSEVRGWRKGGGLAPRGAMR